MDLDAQVESISHTLVELDEQSKVASGERTTEQELYLRCLDGETLESFESTCVTLSSKPNQNIEDGDENIKNPELACNVASTSNDIIGSKSKLAKQLPLQYLCCIFESKRCICNTEKALLTVPCRFSITNEIKEFNCEVSLCKENTVQTSAIKGSENSFSLDNSFLPREQNTCKSEESFLAQVSEDAEFVEVKTFSGPVGTEITLSCIHKEELLDLINVDIVSTNDTGNTNSNQETIKSECDLTREVLGEKIIHDNLVLDQINETAVSRNREATDVNDSKSECCVANFNETSNCPSQDLFASEDISKDHCYIKFNDVNTCENIDSSPIASSDPGQANDTVFQKRTNCLFETSAKDAECDLQGQLYSTDNFSSNTFFNTSACSSTDTNTTQVVKPHLTFPYDHETYFTVCPVPTTSCHSSFYSNCQVKPLTFDINFGSKTKYGFDPSEDIAQRLSGSDSCAGSRSIYTLAACDLKYNIPTSTETQISCQVRTPIEHLNLLSRTPYSGSQYDLTKLICGVEEGELNSNKKSCEMGSKVSCDKNTEGESVGNREDTFLSEFPPDRSDGSDSGLGSELVDERITIRTDSQSSDELDSAVSKWSSFQTDMPALPSTSKHPRVIKSNLKRKFHAEGGIDGPAARKTKRSIEFENVSIFYFPRTQGFTCVPSQVG